MHEHASLPREDARTGVAARGEAGVESIHLPSPTVWPMVLALGVTLLIAGLITNAAISVLGAVFAIAASVGWFRNVLPHEHHEEVQVPTTAADRAVAALAEPQPLPATAAGGQTRLTYSFLSGVEAGAAGGAAMALVATGFGLVRFHSFWYAINLMAASSFLSWSNASDAFLSGFHLQGLLAGMLIHMLISVLVGLLYAATMPIFPRLSILAGGILGPLVWTGLAFSLMKSVAPILGARVDWTWFIVSQIAFGITAVWSGNLRVRFLSTEFQAIPFDQRAGLHSNKAQDSAASEVRQ